ncbi:PTS sugar transporter subunit IIC [Companilactobacillus sp. HBUAS56257]|uniref:PTS sugar transporter subunit IIC n=1 Tax=Companilactobacillus sp. HBUAS56257 TaxID=3109360 RepID=UPI002FF1822C
MKDKIQGFFEKITPTLEKISANKYLQTIMAAMMATLGPIILGSVAILVNLATSKLKIVALTNVLNAINTFTIGAMALYIAFLMAKYLVPYFLKNDDGTMAGIISIMSFLILTPLGQITQKSGSVAAIPTTWLSAQGVFSAMITGLIVGRIYAYIRQHGWTIKMPSSVPPMVSQAFSALIPAIVIGSLFGVISFLFALTSWGSVHQMIFSLIQTPLNNIGGSIWSAVFVSLLMQILWFFGIHGTNVINPLVTPVWLAMDMQNLNAASKGQPLPNIVGGAFFHIVCWGGLALGLVLLMTFTAKSKQYKELGRISIVPALFGITEPVIFGTPLVLNFDLAVPFITNNSIALIIAYVLTKMGIVSRFIGSQAVFGLPLGFHAAVEGSISIIVMQLLIQLVLSPLLWYPWFKRMDNKAYKLEQQSK